MALHKNDYKCCQLIVSIEFLILCKYKKAQFIEIDITHTFIYSFFFTLHKSPSLVGAFFAIIYT